MPTKQEKITRVEETLKSTLNPVFAMAGVANPVVTAVMFGLGIIFRFVRLGAEVRRQNEAAEQALEEAVRAEGIFRMPVNISLNFSTIVNFFMNECELLYPLAYKQLEPERKILLNKSDPRWKEAFETLELAFRILPDIYFDQKFDDNPVLDDLFGKWLDPGNPDYGGLVRELRLFMQQDELSIDGLQAMLPSFIRQRLNDMGVEVADLSADQLARVSEEVGGIVTEALTGDEGLLQETLSFAVDKRKENLESRLDELANRREELEGLARSEDTGNQSKELEQINKRIEETESMLGRISELS